MPAIKLCEDELTALFGLPHLSITLYVLGLRPRMDFVNATVGQRPLISWQALREAVYVEPHPGIKHEYASMQAVRRAAGWLEKAGLIRMRSHDRQLVFFLPYAHADYAVRNKADRGPTDQADRGPTERKPHKQGATEDFIDQSRQEEIGKADSHPVTGIPTNTSSPVLELTAVDLEEGGQGEESILIFPKTLTPHQKAAMRLKIDGLEEGVAQLVLNELEACIQAGTVKSLPKLADFFVQQAKNGQFMPDKGVAVARAREAAKNAEQIRIDSERRASEEAASFIKGKGKPSNLSSLVKRRYAPQEENPT